MKKTIILTFLIVGMGLGTSWAMSRDEALEHFVKANLLYKQEKYQEAVQEYQQILQSGWESGPLYYNLGNSYFKAGDLGRAILNFSRAQRFLPRDADLKANLQFARAQSRGSFSEQAPGLWQRALQQVFAPLTQDELALLILGMVAVVMVLHLGTLFFHWSPVVLRYGLWIGGLVLLVSLAGLGTRISYEKDLGIIVTRTASRFEPRDGATSYFECYEGERVWSLQSQGEWVKVRRSDGKTGWIRREDFAMLF